MVCSTARAQSVPRDGYRIPPGFGWNGFGGFCGWLKSPAISNVLSMGSPMKDFFAGAEVDEPNKPTKPILNRLG